MPLDEKRPGFTRKTLRYRKNLTSAKSIRPATLLIDVIAVVAVAAFSVTVSRSAGWLWKSQPQPSAPSSSSSKPEPVKTSTSAPAASVDSHRPLGPNAALLAPTITATKTDSFTDADNDGKAEPGQTVKYTVNIGASGEDATGVNFTDTVDPNTTFAGGLAASAVAVNDTFPVTVTGNVR